MANMKTDQGNKMKLRQILPVLIMALPLYGLPVSAGETTELRVTASVIANCKILQIQDINFGALDPGQASNASAEGHISFACTRGVDYRMTVDQGENFDPERSSRRMKGNTADYLPYRIDNEVVSGSGTGFSAPLNFSIQASVSGADYRDLPVAAYQDTLRITLEP